jgi:hypothetical protein
LTNIKNRPWEQTPGTGDESGVLSTQNATDRTLIVKPDPQAGWLTMNVEDKTETLLLQQVAGGSAVRATIDLESLQDGYYKLTIHEGAFDPVVLTGWFEIH